MSVSKTYICNQALGELGCKDIADISDDTNEARWCRKFYDSTRDEMLRSGQWKFAIKRIALTELSTTPAFGWSRQFGLPSDYIRGCSLNEVPWHLSSNWIIEAGALLTDCDSANLRYVFRQDDTATYDPLFVRAFYVLLASKIAAPITGDRTKALELFQRYERVDGPAARRIDANESKPRVLDAVQDSKLARSRWVGRPTAFITDSTDYGTFPYNDEFP